MATLQQRRNSGYSSSSSNSSRPPEDKGSDIPSQCRYSFFAANFHLKENKLGEVYTYLARHLHKQRSSDWYPVKATSDMRRCDLILGNNQGGGIDWNKLGRLALGRPLINYCRGFQALTRKSSMAQTLRAFYTEMEAKRCNGRSKENVDCNVRSDAVVKEPVHYNDIVPLTYIFDGKLKERNEFLAEYDRRENEGLDNTWILKPSGGAHGDGIRVMRDVNDILTVLDNAGSSWVVQKYLEKPLLLPGARKFDMRCMVLVDHNYCIYLYSEGILRTCSVAYSLNDLDNRFAHLANHCLQKDHPDYGSFEEEPDNLMGYEAFANLLKRMGATSSDNCPVSLETHILPQIEKQVVYALLAAKEHMEVLDTSSYRCFNLLGFDFMLDDNFKVYLVEVNASPTTDPKLIPQLVEELLRVAVEPLFPSRSPLSTSSNGSGEFKLLWSPIR